MIDFGRLGLPLIDHVHHCRAEDLLAALPDSSIDLIATDPPYFKVKDDAWDWQWDTPAEFAAWIGGLCDEWRRVLKPNGSLYVFASPQMAWSVEGEVRRRFNVLTNVRWQKPPFATKAEMFDKDTMRKYFPASETILFAEQRGANGGTVLGDALRARREAAGVRGTEVDVALGYVRSKDKTRGTELCRRWEEGSSVPTVLDFQRAMLFLDDPQDYEDLRRPFSVSADVPYTDVWTFPTVGAYSGKHPAEKPLALMEHIVTASSRPGAIVLDCFAGSGTTLRAAKKHGRQYIGCDMDAQWVAVARQRLDPVFGGHSVETEERIHRIEDLPLFADLEAAR